jgi:hypothetical protein
MPHVFEPAASGRSKCRGCGRALEKGEIRFGERVANPFADGETTLWFHPMCAAYKRPDSLLEALATATGDGLDRVALERAARASLRQRRLQRIDGAERTARGQARCRQCKEVIERGAWRIRLVFFEEGRFNPSGFIHATCSKAYFETDDIAEQVLYFSANLAEAEREELASLLADKNEMK